MQLAENTHVADAHLNSVKGHCIICLKKMGIYSMDKLPPALKRITKQYLPNNNKDLITCVTLVTVVTVVKVVTLVTVVTIGKLVTKQLFSLFFFYKQTCFTENFFSQFFFHQQNSCHY